MRPNEVQKLNDPPLKKTKTDDKGNVLNRNSKMKNVEPIMSESKSVSLIKQNKPARSNKTEITNENEKEECINIKSFSMENWQSFLKCNKDLLVHMVYFCNDANIFAFMDETLYNEELSDDDEPDPGYWTLKNRKHVSVRTTNHLTRALKSGPKNYEEALSRYKNNDLYRLIRKKDLKKLCSNIEGLDEALNHVTQEDIDCHNFQTENRDRKEVAKYYRASIFLQK